MHNTLLDGHLHLNFFSGFEVERNIGRYDMIEVQVSSLLLEEFGICQEVFNK